MASTKQKNSAQQQAQLLLSDFRNFLFLVWKHLGLPDPTPVQYEIAEWLQHGPRRKITEGFRGVGKSWITSAYVCWKLRKNPDYKFLVVSASKGRADDFTTFTRRLIREIPFLAPLHPKENQRDSMIAFDVGPAKAAHAPSVKSVGIFGQLTGSRADEIVADDVEVPNNASTQDMREKLLKRVLEFEDIIVPGGLISYLGTPQTEESVYNKLQERGYTARIWPARYPELQKIHAYNGALAPRIADALKQEPQKIIGRSTDPKRFNDIDLLEREAAKGRSEFALQFMLDTSLSDAEKYPLKLSDLIVLPLDSEKAPVSIQWASAPELQYKEFPNLGFSGDRIYRPLRIDEKWTPYEGSVMAIDPSGRGTDETGYAVVKQLHGYQFVTALGGFKGGYDDSTLVALARVAREQQVNYIVIEANFGDGMFTKIFTPVLARYWPCTIEEVKHSIQKEKRIIDTLEPVMNRHRLVIDYGIIDRDIEFAQKEHSNLNYSLLYQMTRITKERGALKHDDKLDVLSMAVGYWVNAMARDEHIALESYKERMLDKELKNFMKHVVGARQEEGRNKDIRLTF